MQWMEQESGFIRTSLRGVSFADDLSGWVVGDYGLILHTSDAGQTWKQQQSGVWLTLNAVCFPTLDFGCAVGEFGTILTTADRGKTWRLTRIGQGDPERIALYDVHFVSPKVGWACGEKGPFDAAKGFILATSDGGQTWRELSNPLQRSVATIHFVDSACGWAAGSTAAIAGDVIATRDGGQTWTAYKSGANIITSVSFSDRQNGWAVDYYGSILRTTDGGQTWQKKYTVHFDTTPSGGFPNLYAVQAVTDTICLAVGNEGKIASTFDAGATWTVDRMGWDRLRAINFSNHGWVVGDSGTILASVASGGPISRGTHRLAVDLMALILPPEIYQKWAEGGHPHTPAELERLVRRLGPAQLPIVRKRAAALREVSAMIEKLPSRLKG